MGAGAIKQEQDKEFLNHCSIDIGRNDAKEHIRQLNSINTISYRLKSKVNTFCEITKFGEMDKVSWPISQTPFPTLTVFIEALGLQLS
jgi:hypothetical protein